MWKPSQSSCYQIETKIQPIKPSQRRNFFFVMDSIVENSEMNYFLHIQV